MTKQQHQPPAPPRGWKAIPWRLPIWLYRLGLGFLLGERFLLLHHIGRKSGKVRQAVLEVMRKETEPLAYVVGSGFGERAQWFRNVMHTPEVVIQVGRRRYRARAERLPYEEALACFRQYAREHPIALRELSRLLHSPYDGSEAGLEAMAHAVPVVRFLVTQRLGKDGATST